MRAPAPPEPIGERPVKSAAPKTTGPLIVQIYAKGMREAGKLSELQHALQARPDWRYRLDTPHDFVFLEADNTGFSAEEISSVFRQIGLEARFVTHRTRRANARQLQLGDDDRHPREDSVVASEAPKRGLAMSVSMPDPESLPLYVRNVATLRGLGFSFPQIARHYGVTPQAISVLLTRQRASLKQGQAIPELAGLSPRAANCLGRLRIATRAEARKHRDLQKELHAQRNCGQKTLEEILRWAQNGKPDPSRGARSRQTKKLRPPYARASIQPV